MNNKKMLFTSYTLIGIGTYFLLSLNVRAYIDPSVMTYAIQAVAGVVIAVAAFVGIYFRKAKKKISNKLGIDENKNKEVEKDEIIVKSKKNK